MLRIGETADKYKIEALIGQGGMAAVYRARHVTLDSLHAVKILFITAPTIRQRLLREGKVQANLRHQNIVAVTDVLEVQGAPALVMEYVDGPALDQWLNENTPTLDEALFLFKGILRGIMAAHERGVIHRDLKPANVMLAPTNEGVVPKVTDFGLVKSLADRKGKTQTGMAMGTPEYMAPEQIRDASDVDQRVDMFALGCILYELVTHKRAFAGPDNVSIFNNIVSGTYPPPRKFVDDLPPTILEAIRRLLEADPEQRMSSCAELFELLYPDHAAVGRLAGVFSNVAPISINQTLPDLVDVETTTAPEAPPPLPDLPLHRPDSDDGELTPSPTAGGGGLTRYTVPVVLTLVIGMALGGALTLLQEGPSRAEDPRAEASGAPGPAADPPDGQGELARTSPPPVPGSGEASDPAQDRRPVDGGTPPPDPVGEPLPSDGSLSGRRGGLWQVGPGGRVEPPRLDAPPAPTLPPAPARAPRDPTPRPEVAPAPTQVGQPPPEPPEAAGAATVSISGDARGVWLEANGATQQVPGSLPPGSYRVLADFGDGKPVSAGETSLRPGEAVTLDCSSFLFQCRRR